MSWDKINLGDVVQGVWDNYYYLVVSTDKARQVKIICIEAAYRDHEDSTRFGMKQLFLFAIVKYTTYLKIKQN